jgi:hypothetical protein
VKKDPRQPSFEEALERLRARSFEVAAFPGLSGAVLVSKNGAGAVIASAGGGGVALAQGPGVLLRGELARLVDRGYQKFLKTSRGELPATAAQLHAIHDFGEELRQVAGAASLYNEALGTTSDLYLYDRLVGREEPEAGEEQRKSH